MAYGDVSYQFIRSGSTATSAATAHDLFGIYDGLSDVLNDDDVTHLQVSASVVDFRLGPSDVITNDNGLKITAAASLIDIPPIKVSDARIFQFVREAATDASALWVIWQRNAL
jgi:hypothetical protein